MEQFENGDGIIKFYYRPQEERQETGEPPADGLARESADALCDRAAQRYEEGDEAQAVKLWFAAAEKDHAHAQYCLGVCFLEGIGVEQDYGEAAAWFGRSAMQGNP